MREQEINNIEIEKKVALKILFLQPHNPSNLLMSLHTPDAPRLI